MGLFGKLAALAINIVETPVVVIKDIATLGGALADQEEPYTAQKLKEMGDRIDIIKDELDSI